MAHILACFHWLGMHFCSSDLLNIIASGSAMVSPIFLINLGWIPSGPGDLFGFNFCVSLIISFSSIFKSFIFSFTTFSTRYGISPSGSLVNTFEKYSANTWAFSSSLFVVGDFSSEGSIFMSPMPGLILDFELIYFRSFLGLFWLL